MDPKITDFSLAVQGARFMSKPKPIQVDRIVGTYGYKAAEYAKHGTLTDKCDVFSFGMLLLEVVCGRKYKAESKFSNKPIEEEINPNIKGKIAPECWEVFIDIIKRCVMDEPDERPTMGEVEVELEHALSLQEQADTTNTNGHYYLIVRK